MTEWSDQITELQRNWVEQQQELLNGWLDSMKSAGGSSLRASWRKAADVMEQQVTSALDAQKQSLLSFVENMENIENAPDGLTLAVNQLEENIEQWAEVQRGIWKVWFDTLRSTAPAPQTPGEALMENWEDMVKRTMSIQEEWLSKWTDLQAPKKGSTKSGSAKKT